MSKLTDELQRTKDDLLATLNTIENSAFNVIPFDGSWTAGQTTQHTLLAVGNLPNVLLGNIKPTERDPKENVEMIRNMFLDFQQKYKSPEAINPPNMKYDKAILYKALETAFDELIKIEQSADLTLTCTDMEFPTVGQLTRLELINFANVHTIRHIHQLQGIKAHLITN